MPIIRKEAKMAKVIISIMKHDDTDGMSVEYFPFRVCDWDLDNELHAFPGHYLKGFKTLKGCKKFLYRQGYSESDISIEEV